MRQIDFRNGSGSRRDDDRGCRARDGVRAVDYSLVLAVRDYGPCATAYVAPVASYVATATVVWLRHRLRFATVRLADPQQRTTTSTRARPTPVPAATLRCRPI